MNLSSVFFIGPVCQNLPCICPPGFTGRSDWMNYEGILCHVNHWIVTALWSLLMFAWMILLITSIPKFKQIYHRFFGSKKKRTFTFKHFPANLGALGLIFLLIFPLTYVIAFIRIFDDTSRIGFSIVLTILWGLNRGIFYLVVAIHQPSLLRKILEADNSSIEVISDHIFRLRLICLFSALNSLLIIPVFFYPEDLNIGRACFGLFLVTYILGIISITLVAKNIDVKLQRVLEESYEKTKNEAILTLKNKLHILQQEAIKTGILQMTFFGIWLACPPFWALHDYFLPISWFPMVLVGRAIINALYIRPEETTNLTEFQRKSKTQTELVMNDRETSGAKKTESIRFARPPL